MATPSAPLGAILALVIGIATACHQNPASAGPDVLAIDAYARAGTVDLLIAARTENGYELRHRRSSDGGRTWDPDVLVPLGGAPLSNPNRGRDPQLVAFGSKLLAVWTTKGTSPVGDGPLHSARSEDGGRSWAPGPRVDDDATTGGHPFQDLAADAEGVFYAIWLDRRDGDQGLRAAVSRDHGRSWTPNQTIDARVCECCWTKLLVPGPGSAFVLYRDRGPRDMRLAATQDGGASWELGPTVGAFEWSIEACPHTGAGLAATAAGHLHAAVWTAAEGHQGVYQLASSDAGKSWTAPGRLGSTEASNPDLAAGGKRLLAAWDDDGRIWSSLSADQGKTWTTPRALTSPGAGASHPLVLWTGEGFLVLWTERQGEQPSRLGLRSL